MKLFSFRNDDKTKISSHFSLDELRCHCGKCNITFIDIDLLTRLEEIRLYFNVPLFINSAYRCPDHNTKVAGQPFSYHMRGQAVDIAFPGSVDREKFINKCRNIFNFTKVYNTFIHCDTRGIESEEGV